jgi:hypothetical protein
LVSVNSQSQKNVLNLTEMVEGRVVMGKVKMVHVKETEMD